MSANQALAVQQAPASGLADVGRLTRDQIEIIKLTIARGATDLELAFFIEVCKQRGLDPFMGEIYFAKFHDRKTNTDVVVPINAADGYRKYANRSADYLGQVGPLWCGPDGNWRDIWLDPQPPAAAKVGVLRRGNPEPTWGYAKWSEFAKTGEDAMFWRKMPAHQLALAAERQALRKSFGQQREDLRLLDSHHLLAKAQQLLRVAAPPEHPLIESEAQRQEQLFGHDEPETTDAQVERAAEDAEFARYAGEPGDEPPEETTLADDESRRADLMLGMVEAYTSATTMKEAPAGRQVIALCQYHYKRTPDNCTLPELEALAGKIAAHIRELTKQPGK